MKLFYLILSILSTWTIFSTSLCKNLRFINFFYIYLKIQNKLLNYLDAQNVTMTSAATKISDETTATSLLMEEDNFIGSNEVNNNDEEDNGSDFDNSNEE